MKATLIAAVLATLPLLGSTASAEGDCKVPIWYPTEIVRIGPHTWSCETYFLFVHVYTSSTPCQDAKRTTPGHYKCSTITSTIEDCVVGLDSVIESTQPYKGECEGATGLSVDIGGVEVGIDWWRAVCKKDGAPTNVVITTDSRIACDTATSGTGDGDGDGDGDGGGGSDNGQ